MLPPKLPEPQTIEATKDCICFGVDEVNKTLPEKCHMLYQKAIQVEANYIYLMIGIGGLIILFLAIVVLLYLNLKRGK